jgi:DNA-binding SARP family transcriptional activator
MAQLHVHLFGGFRAIRGDRGSAELPLSRAAQALLAYLILNRHRRHPREVLAAIFWGDAPEDRARACLATALWRLRRGLGPSAGGEGWIVVAPSGDVTFDGGDGCRVDAAELEAAVRPALTRPPSALDPAETDALERALELYTGELLEGVYHEWAQRERDRFRHLFHDGAWLLMRALAHRGEWERSAAWGERIVRDDPLREDVHRELMRVHAAAPLRRPRFARGAAAPARRVAHLRECARRAGAHHRPGRAAGPRRLGLRRPRLPPLRRHRRRGVRRASGLIADVLSILRPPEGPARRAFVRSRTTGSFAPGRSPAAPGEEGCPAECRCGSHPTRKSPRPAVEP